MRVVLSFADPSLSRAGRYGTPQTNPVRRRASGRSQRLFSVSQVGHTVMILPQVHLRKPCYDFYFLCVVMSGAGFVLTARHMCLSTLLFPRPPCFAAH